MEENKEPFDIIIDNIKTTGTFYTEKSENMIRTSLESNYHPDLVRKYGIEKVIPSEKGFILKWYRRLWVLTDSELTNMYGENYLLPYKQKAYLDAKAKASKQRRNQKPDSSQGD